MFKWIKHDSLRLLSINRFKEFGVKAYFTSKKGGISEEDYVSLNLGLHTSDDNDNVLFNRKLVCEAVGIDNKSLVIGEQVHGNNVYVVTEKDRGKGALEYANSIKGVDALITNVKDLPLFSFYADCTPLFFLDPVHKIVGLAHAGWKGTVKKTAVKTLEKMIDRFNIQPEDCIVGIGPTISQNNYEVDENVVNKIMNSFGFYSEVIEENENKKYHLDLPKTNYMMLEKAGVLSENIIDSSMCTFDLQEYFYSYRRDDGKTGRMASIISL
jgi:hypothetical protein